jgi:hypothetical protein
MQAAMASRSEAMTATRRSIDFHCGGTKLGVTTLVVSCVDPINSDALTLTTLARAFHPPNGRIVVRDVRHSYELATRDRHGSAERATPFR